MKNNCSKYLGVVTLGGGSDEHPMSTRSASDGRRWHSRGMQLICTLVLLFTFAIGNVWADLTAHVPGVYEKTVATGGYGCTLTTVASGENAGTFEVYYFSAQSKYSENTSVYNGGTKQQYRLMCTDSDSEYQLINRNGTGTFTASCDWIEMAYSTTGFSKSDYTFGSTTFNEFFEITPNGGNTGITKTCYIKPKEGDVLTLKVSGYVEFAILGSDNGSSKYMTVAVDGGTPTSWKSNTLSRRSVTFTTEEHTIVVANVGTSANAFYGFSLKLPAATKHSVEYDLNGGEGTTPTQADVAEGAKFTLHDGTTSITAPSGKQFAGWNDGTTTYAGGAEYTMGTDDVELTAVWETAKTNPTATFSNGAYVVGASALDLSGLWSSNSDGAVTYALKEASDDASVSGTSFTATKAGSYVVTASQAATSTYNAIEKEATITVTWPATGDATIIYNVAVGTSESSFTTANMDDNSASISNLVGFTANNIAPSGSGKAKSSPKLETPQNKVQNKYVSVTFDVAEGKEFVLDSVVTQIVAVSSDKTIEVVVVAGETKDSLNYSQGTNSDPGNSHQFNFSANAKAYTGTVTVKIYAYGATDGYRIGKPLKVCGKVQNAKVVKTTDYALTDVKVNGTSISAANLATLKTASAYKVDLADQFAAAPTIKFNKETTITYTDDSQKVTDEEISVDATTVDGKWQAQAEIGGITYTVTAVKVTSFTVNYFDEDGTTSLGSEVVSVTGHPNASEITVPTKSFKTFADWKLSGTVVDLNNVSAGAGETVTLVASYTPAYAQSINIEQWVLDNSKNNTAFRAVLDARHYEYANLNDVDSLRADKNDGDRNEPYLGQKWKLATSEISFLLKSGYTVRVKFGNVGSNVNIKLGDNDPFAKTAAQLESPYEYTATEDVIVRLQGTGTGTVVVKQIMIDEAIAAVKLHAVVTYDAGAGTFGKANEKYTGTPLVIADATPAEDYTFAGWFLGEDQINAAAYEPTKNVTLVAHYAPKEYAIAYDGNGATSGLMSAGAAGWGTMVTPDANAFEKTGHVFSGWEITKTSDGSATGITFSEGKFEMPKYDVTLVAQWEDNSKVAVIVETNVKYNDLAAAIEAAEPGQTVQLIQDINQEEAILIAKNLTLDLNNKTFTVTNPSDSYSNRAIKVTAGTIVIENGTVDALSNETHNSGCWGSLRQEGGNLTCNNVTFKNYRSGGLGLKPVGGTLILNECTVLSEIGGGLELGNATVEVTNCTFTQTGTDANKIYGACFGMGKMGTLTINGGTYTSDNYSFYIYTSGGTINVNSGTFAGDVKTEMNNTQYPSAVGTINISGGTFDGVGENPIVFTAVTANDHISISGGVFDAPIENQYCAEGYVPQDNGDNTYGVTPKDGVCIIKATTNNEVTGLIGGTIDQSFSGNADSRKLNKSTYFGVTLANSETFQEGDVMVVNITTAADLGQFMVYADAARTQLVADQGIVYTKADPSSTGEMSITLPAAANGKTSLYLSREDGDTQWNVTFSYIEVKRPMKPVLTAITINSVDADIDEANKAVAITLPEATTDLGALTVVPTIVWNEAAATNSIVVNNGAAWHEGANTYKLTDKDGDATTYTVTITLQGEAPAPVITTQPADVAYCAGSEPTLTVEATGDELHYAWFKEAGETDEAVGSDQASYTVASAGTYYVIVTNHVDTKLDKSVTSANAVVTLNIAAAITKQPTNKRDIALNSEVTLSVEATNATGYQWYICDDAEKTNASAIDNEDGANYVFNCTANAYYYCVVGNACGADIESNVVSVKLEPVGCNVLDGDLPTASPYIYDNGEWTLYAVTSAGKHDGTTRFVSNAKDFDGNTVKAIEYSRFGMTFAEDVESMTIYATSSSSDRAISSIKVTTDDITTGTPSYADVTFTASAEKLGKKDSSSPYRFVLEANDMLLEAGKKYWFAFSGTIDAFKICYTAAIEKPVIATQPATKIDFAAGDMTATVVVNAVTEGTLKYQWYNADGDVAVEGATSATLTTTTEGTYYVIVRNTLAGHKDYAVKSEEATLAYRQEDDATLSALSVSAGTLDPAFNKNVIEYRVDLPKGTTTVPTLTATATMAAYGATAVKTEATEFENYEAVSTVLVTAEDHTTQKTYTVHYYVAHTVAALVDVTENTTWDWSLVTKDANGADITNSGVTVNESVDGLIIASYLVGDNFDKIEGNNGAYAIRNGSDKKVYQGASLHFHSTKGGYLSIWAANEGHSMTLNVQNAGRDMKLATLTGSQVEYKVYVQAGDVVIYNVPASGTNPMRVSKIVFTVDETPNYTRNVSNNIGTLCVDHNVLAGGALGATFYQIASRNELYDYKIDFEEVLPGEELKAGEPYIFQSTTGRIDLFFGETVADEPVAVRGMIGNYAAGTLEITEENQHTILYIAQNKLWTCGNLVGQNLILNEHRAYIDMTQVPTYAEYTAVQNPAPGRRRVTLGKDAEQTATGIDAINASEKPMKIMIEGQIYILRGEKVFDATGRLVK